MTSYRPKRSYQRRQPVETPKAGAVTEMHVAEFPDALRSEMRPEPRQAMREEDPRTRAAKRAAELRGHIGEDDGTDEFYIDPATIPEGWSYEWKRKTVMNQEDPSYQVSLARKGWESVPSDRHPEFMPDNWSGNVIERKGMVLMERPLEITKDSEDRAYREAVAPVRGMEAKLAGVAPGQFERSTREGSLVKVKKSYSPMPIPE